MKLVCTMLASFITRDVSSRHGRNLLVTPTMANLDNLWSCNQIGLSIRLLLLLRAGTFRVFYRRAEV